GWARKRGPASAQASRRPASTRATKGAVCCEKRSASVPETAARRAAAARQRPRARASAEDGGRDVIDRAYGVGVVGESAAHGRRAGAAGGDLVAGQPAGGPEEPRGGALGAPALPATA